MENIELVSLDGIVTIMSIGAALAYFLIPSFVVLIGIFTVRRIKKNRLNNENKKQTVIKEEEQLDGIENEPVDKGKYSSLALNFDETGSVKS